MAELFTEKYRQTLEKRREQIKNLDETGKYRFGQVGINKESNHIIFYADKKSNGEIYYILIPELKTHDKQILLIKDLLEKQWFTKKVLEEFLIVLGLLGLMPERD